MKTAGAIIAGGKSSRMGGREKAFLDLDGRPLLQHIVERLAPQVDTVFINANGDSGRFARFGLAVVADAGTGLATPLAGLLAALNYAAARGFEAVMSVPSDTPYLPPDLVARLASALPPVIASNGGQAHFIIGLWPVRLAGILAQQIEQKSMRRVQDFTSLIAAREVEWPVGPHDPFANINTPEDLEVAKAQSRR